MRFLGSGPISKTFGCRRSVFSAGYDAEVVRGIPASRSFPIAYLRDGRVIALDCISVPRDFV